MGLEGAVSRSRTNPVAVIGQEEGSLLWLKLSDQEALGDDAQKIILNNIISLLADDHIRLMYKLDVLSIKGLRERIMAHLSIICEKKVINLSILG